MGGGSSSPRSRRRSRRQSRRVGQNEYGVIGLPGAVVVGGEKYNAFPKLDEEADGVNAGVAYQAFPTMDAEGE